MHVWVYLLECDWSTQDHNFKRSSTFSLSSHQQSVAPQITSAPTHAGIATVLISWRSATAAMKSWGQQSCYPLCFCLPVLLELKKQVTADHLSTWKHSFLPLGHISQQNKNSQDLFLSLMPEYKGISKRDKNGGIFSGLRSLPFLLLQGLTSAFSYFIKLLRLVCILNGKIQYNSFFSCYKIIYHPIHLSHFVTFTSELSNHWFLCEHFKKSPEVWLLSN